MLGGLEYSFNAFYSIIFLASNLSFYKNLRVKGELNHFSRNSNYLETEHKQRKCIRGSNQPFSF